MKKGNNEGKYISKKNNKNFKNITINNYNTIQVKKKNKFNKKYNSTKTQKIDSYMYEIDITLNNISYTIKSNNLELVHEDIKKLKIEDDNINNLLPVIILKKLSDKDKSYSNTYNRFLINFLNLSLK